MSVDRPSANSKPLIGPTLGYWHRVPHGIFRKPEYRSLSLAAKVVLSWLAFGPRSGAGTGAEKVLGIVDGILPSEIARQVGISPSEAEAAFSELEAQGWIVYDPDAICTAIPAAVAVGPCRNVRAVQGWVKSLDNFPQESPAVFAYVQAIVSNIIEDSKAWPLLDKEGNPSREKSGKLLRDVFHESLHTLAKRFPGLALEPLDMVCDTVSTQGQETGDRDNYISPSPGEETTAPRGQGTRTSREFLEIASQNRNSFTEEGLLDHVLCKATYDDSTACLHIHVPSIFVERLRKNSTEIRQFAKLAGFSDGAQIHKERISRSHKGDSSIAKASDVLCRNAFPWQEENSSDGFDSG